MPDVYEMSPETTPGLQDLVERSGFMRLYSFTQVYKPISISSSPKSAFTPSSSYYANDYGIIVWYNETQQILRRKMLHEEYHERQESYFASVDW